MACRRFGEAHVMSSLHTRDQLATSTGRYIFSVNNFTGVADTEVKAVNEALRVIADMISVRLREQRVGGIVQQITVSVHRPQIPHAAAGVDGA
jgi:hypothetical protein